MIAQSKLQFQYFIHVNIYILNTLSVEIKNYLQHYTLRCFSYKSGGKKYSHEKLSETKKLVKYYGRQFYQKFFQVGVFMKYFIWYI